MRSVVDEADHIPDLARNGHGGQNYGDRREYMSAFSLMELSENELIMVEQFVQGL